MKFVCRVIRITYRVLFETKKCPNTIPTNGSVHIELDSITRNPNSTLFLLFRFPPLFTQCTIRSRESFSVIRPFEIDVLVEGTSEFRARKLFLFIAPFSAGRLA